MRRHRSRSDVPDGPRTFAELQQWHVNTLKRCTDQGWDCEWADRSQRSVYLTAKWAGLGGMPVGFSYACSAINESQNTDVSVDLKFYSMADFDRCCQGNVFLVFQFDRLLFSVL